MDYSPIISKYKWSKTNITYSFLKEVGENYANDPIFSESFRPLSAAMQGAMISIFNPVNSGDVLRPVYFSDVSGLKFSLISSDAIVGDIAIGSYQQSTSAGFLPDGTPHGGDVWLGLGYVDPAPLGTYSNYVLLHEIGHSLGLEHGNTYPNEGAPPSPPHLDIKFDSMKYTVMSYNPDPNAAGGYPIGLQQLDIAALQEMYGTSFSTRADDTVYKFTKSPGILTIWDGGGKDKIDAQAFTDSILIDLRPGHFSSIGATENVAMALVSHLSNSDQSKPLIENARGGSADDILIGNTANNNLEGGPGKNQLFGMDGNDLLISEGAGDTLHGGTGNDALINKQRDGNTVYIFEREDGHDGILDMPDTGDKIDVLLKGIQPSDIKLEVMKFDAHTMFPTLPAQSYWYSWTFLKIASTGDSLLLPWVCRNVSAMAVDPDYAAAHNYANDSIQFEGGPTWDMQELEKYVTATEVATYAELGTYNRDPVTNAFMTPEVMSYLY